tara:strand:+ start:742 stop:879 length:138 start_codon:yes stop_codon:yes gene_type:complete
MDKFIKTQCGLEKYKVLKQKNGFFHKVRFIWFIFIASIRDSLIKF